MQQDPHTAHGQMDLMREITTHAKVLKKLIEENKNQDV